MSVAEVSVSVAEVSVSYPSPGTAFPPLPQVMSLSSMVPASGWRPQQPRYMQWYDKHKEDSEKSRRNLNLTQKNKKWPLRGEPDVS